MLIPCSIVTLRSETLAQAVHPVRHYFSVRAGNVMAAWLPTPCRWVSQNCVMLQQAAHSKEESSLKEGYQTPDGASYYPRLWQAGGRWGHGGGDADTGEGGQVAQRASDAESEANSYRLLARASKSKRHGRPSGHSYVCVYGNSKQGIIACGAAVGGQLHSHPLAVEDAFQQRHSISHGRHSDWLSAVRINAARSCGLRGGAGCAAAPSRSGSWMWD